MNRTARQMHFPLTAMKPVCPLCRKPADVLGQYGPLWPHYVCRACSLAEPYPVEVFARDTKSKDKSRLRIDPNAPLEARNLRVRLDNLVKERSRKRPRLTSNPTVKINLSGRDLRAPVRYGPDYRGMWRKARQDTRAHQLRWGICDQCGQPHERKTFFENYQPLCQACEDQQTLETLWRFHDSILNDDDIETTLDRLYKSFPGLFERGVLPDAWFELKRQEAVNSLNFGG